MQQTKQSHISIKITYVSGFFLFLLSAITLVFIYEVFFTFVKPVFLNKPKPIRKVALGAYIDDVVMSMKGAPNADLTGASASATLTNESQKLTAEIINGSGITGAGEKLSDALSSNNITVAKVSSSPSTIDTTVVAIKDEGLSVKDIIAQALGTESATLVVQKLESSYPFDIKIILGQ